MSETPRFINPGTGKQRYFGMKARIGADAEPGLVHTVWRTPANVNDVVEGNSLLHGSAHGVFADAGYQRADKRPDAKETTDWQVAMKPGKRRTLDKSTEFGQLSEQIEKLKTSVRAKHHLGSSSAISDTSKCATGA